MSKDVILKTFLLEQMNKQNIAKEEQQNLLRDMVALLIDNEWYGMKISLSNTGDETELFFSDKYVIKMESNIQFFLEHNRKTIPEKVEILLHRLNEKYPLTTSPKNRLYFLKRKKEPCPYCKGLRRKMHHFL